MRSDRPDQSLATSPFLRLMSRLLLVPYAYCVLWITLLNRYAGTRRSMLTPFWELRTMLDSHRYGYWLGQIGGNLLMLLPLGFLLPLASEEHGRADQTILTGALCSVLIELTQYITGRGLCELDDMLHNTIGAAVGYALYLLFARWYRCRNAEK